MTEDEKFQAVSEILFADLVLNHPEKIQQLLESHDEPFNYDNPGINTMRMAALSEEKGDWFNKDLEKIANEANYFNIGDAFDSVKGLVQGATPAVKPFLEAATGKAIEGALGVPGIGAIAGPAAIKAGGIVKNIGKNVLQGIFNRDGKAGDISEAALKKAADGATDDDKESFWLKYKKWIIGAAIVIALIIVILVIWKVNKAKTPKTAPKKD